MKRYLLVIVMISLFWVHSFGQNLREMKGDNEYRNDSLLFGFLMGFPSLFGISLGYRWANCEFIVSGGYFPTIRYGAEIQFSVLMYRDPVFIHGITAMCGLSYRNQADAYWNYIGIAYSLYLSALFLRLGIDLGYGNETDSQFYFQFGTIVGSE